MRGAGKGRAAAARCPGYATEPPGAGDRSARRGGRGGGGREGEGEEGRGRRGKDPATPRRNPLRPRPRPFPPSSPDPHAAEMCICARGASAAHPEGPGAAR